MKYILPKLGYQYDALEPYIDARTMEIHYSKHHQAYVDKLNAALEGSGFEEKNLEWLLKNLGQLPEDKRLAVRNNGGGHYNHSLFWDTLGPSGSILDGQLLKAIKSTWGSMEKFKDDFTKLALNRFGSGWVWLGVSGKGLCVYSTANQDNCLMPGVECFCPHHDECQVDRVRPILGLDVWEHAYYLKYQNRRAEYVAAWWQVVNWEEVNSLYMLK
ncbi:MAG: superoxide dismutase [Patescibacteria group bacterium]|nr:superoxide dismutase [Patescibacteria group bacterium]